MKILVAGGTGFIGTTLLPLLKQSGHQISVIISPVRHHMFKPNDVTVIVGDLLNPQFWHEPVREHQIILNLSGSSIFRRWNKKVKDDIYTSRILCTRYIVNALKHHAGENKVFFSASGVGYYGYGTNEPLDEESRHGNGFLARVAVDWEAEALKAREHGVRVILCRFGIVLGRGEVHLMQCILLPVKDNSRN